MRHPGRGDCPAAGAGDRVHLRFQPWSSRRELKGVQAGEGKLQVVGEDEERPGGDAVRRMTRRMHHAADIPLAPAPTWQSGLDAGWCVAWVTGGGVGAQATSVVRVAARSQDVCSFKEALSGYEVARQGHLRW